MQPDATTTAAVTLADDLERHRIEQRAARMRLVIRELRERASFHESRHGEVPAPLRHAIAGFAIELRSLERRLRELGAVPSAARRRAGRFERRTPVPS